MARSVVLAGRCIADISRTVLVVAWCSPLATWSASSSTMAYSALSEPSGLVPASMWHYAFISLFVKDPRLRSWPADLKANFAEGSRFC
jgi:hypothetical protein